AFIFKLPMSVMRTNDPSIRAKVHRAYHFFCMGKKSGRRASGTGPHPENEGPPAGEALRSIRRTLVTGDGEAFDVSPPPPPPPAPPDSAATQVRGRCALLEPVGE